jgi:uncharacterized protein (DUF1697 family)
MDARRHVALIRGINVGKAKRVGMADLRSLVEGLGYADVRTLLNSGNVVFTVRRAEPPARIAERIERAIEKRLGMTARVTVLTAAELAAVVAENPLGSAAADPTRLFVTVFFDLSDRKRLMPLTKRDWAPERLAIGRRVVYQWCPNGQMESALAEDVNRLLGAGATTRNFATMTKLHALLQQA